MRAVCGRCERGWCERGVREVRERCEGGGQEVGKRWEGGGRELGGRWERVESGEWEV